jgi:hypothetical protein
MANAVSPPVTPKTSTSVDPLYSQALVQAKAALAAETAPIQAEQTASDAQYQSRATDATNNAAAVSNLLKGIGPAVNGEYQTGAQNVELAANGFSQGMQDALKGNTDNLNAMLQKLGSPAQLDSHAAQSGDVLYALHGYNPGTMFSQQGANLGAAADLQAGDALLKGQENVKALQGQAIVADQGFQAKIAEMAGKLPGDTQTNYQHLQTLALNDAKFREQVRRDNTDQAYKAAYIKLAYLKYSTGVNEFNSKQSQQQAQFNARQAQQLSIASARLAQQKYISDRSYGLSLAKLGIQQAKLQQTIVANSFKAANGGLTKAQVTKYSSVAQSIAMSSYYGSTKVTTVNGTPKQTAGVGAITFAEALSRELKTGMPVQMALDALERVYPADQRPTDAILAQVLGPLDPSLVHSVAAGAKAAQTAGAAITAGPVAAITHPSAASMGGFLSGPYKATYGRADQGRDIQTTPGAPIVAPGDGYVVRIGSDPNNDGRPGAHFGPGYPIVHFTSGPYAGQTMYIGHTVAAVKPGQQFTLGTVLSHTGHGGPEAGGAPPGWAEIGFAPGGTPGPFGQKPPF